MGYESQQFFVAHMGYNIIKSHIHSFCILSITVCVNGSGVTKKAFSKPGIDRLTELIDIAQRNTIN